MNRKPTQTEINQFVQFTNCNNQNFALNHLQKHNNNINTAIDLYFSEGHNKLYTTNQDQIKVIFDKYKGNSGVMGQQGIMDFFAASDVPLQDILPVIFSCEGQAAAMGQYTEIEFVRAMTCLGLTSENDFKNKKAEIRTRFMSDSATFNKVWKYCFGYMAQGAKYVNKQLCGMMLQVIAKEKYPLTDKVVAFLNSNKVKLLKF